MAEIMRAAPLYVHVHDFCVRMMRRFENRAPSQRGRVGGELVRLALRLLRSIASALTFPAERPRYRSIADHAVLHLLTVSRLAVECGIVSSREHREIALALSTIGKMIGGWKRAAGERKKRQKNRDQGAKAEGPATASSAAARRGTTPGGRARRTATGTTRPTRGRTRDSASSFPPPDTDASRPNRVPPEDGGHGR